MDRSLLTDDSTFEQFLLAEDDLVEAYVRQRLSLQEQARFEQFFLLAPERQEKLRLSRNLHRYANDPIKNPARTSPELEPKRASWWHVFGHSLRPVAIAVVVLLVAVVGYRWFFPTSQPVEIAQQSPSPATIISPQKTPAGTAVLAVELFPGQVRAMNTKLREVKLTPDVRTVEFKLRLLKNDVPRYTAKLQADDEVGQPLAEDFPAQTTGNGSYVLVPVPVTALKAGDYRIRLEGTTANGSPRVEVYSFTIKP